MGIRTRHGLEPSRSMQVPIVGSDRVLGGIIVENYEREYAFGESDVRLLTTVASSMGVALENARLFDETQRLLKETEQRAAELAVINSIQEGMAAELDFQAIVDLVGDKLREVFQTGDIGIRWYDATGRPHSLSLRVRARRAAAPSAGSAHAGRHVVEHVARPASRWLRTPSRKMRRSGIQSPAPTRAKSSIYVPILGGDRVLGAITL